jgi:hypothetical protein
MLRELSAGVPCVFPACAFGVSPMAELVRGGLFVRGFPPDSGDHIGLEIDGEVSEFCVYRVRGEFHCEEIREANPRHLRYSEDDLTMHTLVRTRFYQDMAGDLGITGQLAEVARGIWEIGRRNLPGHGRVKVYFVEEGVGHAEITACIAKHGFKLNCVLFSERGPGNVSLPDKQVQAAQLLVRNGRFLTEAFEDLAASGPDSIPETGVDLDSTPQKLVILGEEFLMPLHKNKPLIGLKYLSMMFDQPRDTIPAWDLFLAGHPGDSDNEEDDDEDGDDPTGSGEIMTGTKRHDKRAKVRPSWEDTKMDSNTWRAVGQDLDKKRKRLESLAKQGVQTGAEARNLKKEIEELKKYLDSGQGADGRKRAIKHSDRDKARDSVRGGIKVVIQHVAKQNPARAEELRNSLDLGYDVMFKPPPDWGI